VPQKLAVAVLIVGLVLMIETNQPQKRCTAPENSTDHITKHHLAHLLTEQPT
jgi:hypothetical protein